MLTATSIITVRDYPQPEIDFSRVPVTDAELEMSRRSHNSFQRRYKKLQDEAWSHYCQTWELLETLLERDGLGWCPVSLGPVKLIGWVVAAIDLEWSVDVNDGGGFHSSLNKQRLELFDVPDYQLFTKQLENLDIIKQARYIESLHGCRHADRLHHCRVGDLFADRKRQEAWQLMLSPENALSNITQAPPELYTQYGLVRPPQTARRYARYLRRYPRP